MPNLVRIDVATVALTDLPESLWPHLMMLLSEEERARSARFRLERNRREYIAAHALKRLMLCETVGGVPQDWEFSAEPWGKPVVANGQGPHFNLSHSDGLVACAVSPGVPVGIDVEPVDQHAPLDVAFAYFSPDERAWLFGLPEAERSLGFFKLWTMKEAFVKATGKGVSNELHTFTIGFDPLRVMLSNPSQAESGEWQCMQQIIGESHLVALAWRGPKTVLTLREVAFQELVG